MDNKTKKASEILLKLINEASEKKAENRRKKEFHFMGVQTPEQHLMYLLDIRRKAIEAISGRKRPGKLSLGGIQEWSFSEGKYINITTYDEYMEYYGNLFLESEELIKETFLLLNASESRMFTMEVCEDFFLDFQRVFEGHVIKTDSKSIKGGNR